MQVIAILLYMQTLTQQHLDMQNYLLQTQVHIDM